MEIREATLAICGKYRLLGTLGNTDMKFRIVGAGDSGIEHLVAVPSSVTQARNKLGYLEQDYARISQAAHIKVVKEIDVDDTTFSIDLKKTTETLWGSEDKWYVLYVGDVLADANRVYEEVLDSLFQLIELTKRNE